MQIYLFIILYCTETLFEVNFEMSILVQIATNVGIMIGQIDYVEMNEPRYISECILEHCLYLLQIFDIYVLVMK